MARVTVTNNRAGVLLVPSPISKKLSAGKTAVYDGIRVPDLEKSKAFKEAMADGTITVVVSDDPNVPSSVETSSVGETVDFMTARGGNIRTDEFTNVAAAAVNALKTSIATAAAPVVYSGAALNGTVGAGEMVPPRNPTITSTANAHVTAVSVVFTGFVRNEAGALVPSTCTIVVTNGGGATDLGDRPLSIVSSITVPAMGGTGGSLQFGFGNMIGTAAMIRSRAGLIAPLRQVAVGAVVTTGTFTNPTGAIVTGYTPATVPNATNDYALTYEV